MQAVTHVHFTAWEDFSVPEADSLHAYKLIVENAVEFINTQERTNSGQKMLVHCRAGIGRTGTTMAIINALIELQSQSIDST